MNTDKERANNRKTKTAGHSDFCERLFLSLILDGNFCRPRVGFASFISVYLCSSVVAMAFVSNPAECYIYPRHAGVNSGIYAMRRLSRWLLLLACSRWLPRPAHRKLRARLMR